MSTNITIIRKEHDHFAIAWRDDQRAEALKTLGRWATTPDLDFTSDDAEVVAEAIRRVEIEPEEKRFRRGAFLVAGLGAVVWLLGAALIYWSLR